MDSALVFLAVVFISFCVTLVSIVALVREQEVASQALQLLLDALRSVLPH